MNSFNLNIGIGFERLERRFVAIGTSLSIAIVAVLILTTFGTPSIAQSGTGSNNALVQEIERLRRDLSDMQRFVYRGDDTGTPPASSSAPPADNQNNPRLQRQILEMQSQMRELTGHIERLQYGVRTMGERLDKLVADVDIRLQALEGGTPVAAGERRVPGHPFQAAPPPTSRPAGTTVISSGGVTGTNAGLAPGQKSLGEISGRDLTSVENRQAPSQNTAPSPANSVRSVAPLKRSPPPKSAPGPGRVTSTVASVARPLDGGELPEGTARQQYEYAFGKLKERNYDGAETALRAFVDRHPDDPLAGNAMYWMGETYYVRKDFSEAARIFLDAFQRFPKGNKAPDNLFKLAKSLVQIGENQSACTTYKELVKTFPRANRRILGGAQADMTRLGCG